MIGETFVISRRAALAGALVFSFSSVGRTLAQEGGAQTAAPHAPPLPGRLKQTPFLNSWIRVGADGNVTVLTGKAELGQGIKTALMQIAAEQLDVEFERLTLVTADTAQIASEGYTAGSHSMQDSGTAILNAAAQVRQLLVAEAATRVGLPADQMRTDKGVVIAPDGKRFAFGELVGAQMLHVQASPQSPLKNPAQFKAMQRSIPRVDIPAKVTGGEAYVQDMRLDGMVHGRVVRPPSYGAQLVGIEGAGVETMPGVLKVVRDGSFLGIIAEREFPAIEAMRALAASARWQETAKLPRATDLPEFLMHLPSHDITVADAHNPAAAAAKSLSATYSRALLARALPGRPVRLQWMREQEQAWEPYGPAMVAKVSASLDGNGSVVDWDYGVWSNTHTMRPGPAGSLLAARYLASAFPEPEPKPIPMPEGGGDRNSIPLYKFPSVRVINHFLPDMPVRVSALRALGAYMNIFAIECFMDELAASAGADPVQFRLKHLDDPRARDVVSLAAQRFGWADAPPRRDSGRGRGFAFARYKNLAAYCAIACEVEVKPDTGQPRLLRAVAAVDSGQVVNPDGIVNQIEGAVLQSMSWTLYENVTFDDRQITSVDWASYPILRSRRCPTASRSILSTAPACRFLGSGEAGQGPASAAVANAIADATGHRLRDLPLSRERIKVAIGA